MRFSHDEPDIVYFKPYVSSPERKFQLLKKVDILPPGLLPTVIQSPGLTPYRQWYLYKKICEYCTPSTQDIVALKPTVDQPTANDSDNEEIDNEAPSTSASAVAKSGKRPATKNPKVQTKNQKASKNK
ncbi:uncharacterized protein LOC117123004 [Anneissia japonica]|uniref:uncharacterized protein LOC117123004 n=1 Tax=Anneissia japonica TaxID=1529436 RepID=UPI001425B67B|nr:uncharacterized protein LOC117123004 [Anneissia japonica]